MVAAGLASAFFKTSLYALSTKTLFNSRSARTYGTRKKLYTRAGKGDNKLGKLLERVRADALAGKDTEVWCAMRFELALPLDVNVALAVSKAGQIVAEPSFEGKPIIRMGERARAV